MPTPVAGRDGQSSCEFLARLQEFALHLAPSACLIHRQPGECDRLTAAIYARDKSHKTTVQT